MHVPLMFGKQLQMVFIALFSTKN
uniref:Uncharacterized protein n=1 Tax=Rhizophora mucronata TaxID=61149 RepID=A0A2P2PC71_RHIMU